MVTYLFGLSSKQKSARLFSNRADFLSDKDGFIFGFILSKNNQLTTGNFLTFHYKYLKLFMIFFSLLYFPVNLLRSQ